MASSVIGALRVNLGIDSAQFQNGLKNAQTGLQKFGNAVKTGLLAAGAAATAAAGAMGVMVRNTINSADEMSKAAQKIGIPIEELSRLKYAADLAGVSFGGLQTGVKKLSQNMNDALAGTGEGAKAFEALGISVAGADGKLKSSTAVMAEIAEKFAAMPDGAEKTALAMDLMGRAGTDMIPLLNGGTEALQKMLAEADQFGQVFTQEMGSSAEAFNDNLTRLQGAFGNLAARLATELLPHLKQFTDWLVANAPAITQFAVSTVEGFASIGRAIGATIEFFNNLDASIRSFGDSLRAGIAQAVQFGNEIVAVFAAIPGKMIEIGEQIIAGLWQGIQAKWESVKSGITGIGSSIVSSFKSVLSIQSPSKVMFEIGQNVMQGLSEGMTSLENGVTSIAESIASTVSNAFMGIIDGSKTVKEALADIAKQLANTLLNSAFKNLFGSFGGGLFSGLGKFFGGFFANGGTLGAGKWGVAGEYGPEIIKGPAQVVPMSEVGERPIHITFGVSADNNGNLMPFVESVSTRTVRAAAPAIIGASTKAVKQSMPSFLSEAQARSL